MTKNQSSPLLLKFHGGAEEVTGSRHLLERGNERILLDCGLFQGHRYEALERTRTFPAPPTTINAVVLSHAHIDHSGGLPYLVKKGFKGPIHCTAPTADLLKIMLMDSAYIQEQDAEFFNKVHAEANEKIEPLYTRSDVEQTLRLVEKHPYNAEFYVTDNFRAQFLNAGHVLGSAMIHVKAGAPKAQRHILFTGDLGRRKSLIMEPPKIPPHVDYLLMESTYGGRHHDPIMNAEKVLAEVINRAESENGPILIPSFALERTQEIIFLLRKLLHENRIKPIHIYVDSPMATDITEIFGRHLDCLCLSDEFKDYVAEEGDPFGFKQIRYIQTVDESKALMQKPGRKIIMAGSGMCEGGRILHHLRNLIGKANTTILLVGYQAQGTLGRQLAIGAKKVKIFGLRHEVVAEVHQLNHFSSHADQSDLLWFVRSLSPRPQKIFLVHGDPEQKAPLVEALSSAGIDRVELPGLGTEYTLD